MDDKTPEGKKYFDLEFYKKDDGNVVTKFYINNEDGTDPIDLIKGFATFITAHTGMIELIKAAEQLHKGNEAIKKEQVMKQILNDVTEDGDDEGGESLPAEG